MIHLILDLDLPDHLREAVELNLRQHYYPTHISRLAGEGTRRGNDDPLVPFIRTVLVTDTPESFSYDVPTVYLRPDLLSDPLPIDDTVSRKLTGMALQEWRAWRDVRQMPKGTKKFAKEIGPTGNWLTGYDVRDTEIVADIDYRLVDSDAQFYPLITDMARSVRYSLDVETNQLDPLSGTVCMTISTRAGRAYYIPDYMIPRVVPHIQWNRVTGHNLKYDVQGMGMYPKRVGDDSHIVSSLIETRLGARGLKEMVEDRFGFQMVEFDDIVPEGGSIADIDPAQRHYYACSDADWSLRLLDETIDELPAESQPIYSIMKQIIPIVAEMEANGIDVDDDALKKLADVQQGLIDDVLARIYSLAGHTFDLNSPQQVSRVLYKELGIKRTSFKTSTGTDENALKKLNHPIAAAILEFRELDKLRNTYSLPLLNKRHPLDGRVHPTFNLALVASGRLSSSNPNAQNIPKTQLYRSVVIAKPPYLILKIDYDQLELRTLAGMSGGRSMSQIFAQNIDIHAHTASIIFDKDIADITDDERQRGKLGNFAIVYGAQESKIIELGLADTWEEAHYIIQQLMHAYPDEIAYINECKQEIRQTRRSITLHGRVRTFSDYVPMDSVEREGFNHIIQGSGIELVFLGMIEAHPIIRKWNAQLFNQVHDEVLIRSRAWEIHRLRDEVVPAMESVPFPVPLKVKAGIADNWWDAA